MAQAKQDMGSGSVKKLMLQLMIPAVVAQVVNLLENLQKRLNLTYPDYFFTSAPKATTKSKTE